MSHRTSTPPGISGLLPSSNCPTEPAHHQVSQDYCPPPIVQQSQHTIRYLRITPHLQSSHRTSTPSGISGLLPSSNCPTEPAHHQVSLDYTPPPIVQQSQHTIRYLWITPHLPSSNRASTPSGISGLLSTTNCPTEPAHHQVSQDYCPPPIVQQSQHTIRYLRITPHLQSSHRTSTPSGISGLLPSSNCPTEPAHHQVSQDYCPPPIVQQSQHTIRYLRITPHLQSSHRTSTPPGIQDYTPPPIVQQSQHTIRYIRITVHLQLSHRTSTPPGISGLHPTSHRPTEPAHHQVSLDYTPPPIVQQSQHTIRYLRITVHHQLSHRASTPSGISGLHPTSHRPTEPAHHQVSLDYTPPPIVPQSQHTIRYIRITVHHQLSHRASTPSGISGLHPTTNCPTEPAHHQVSLDYTPPPIVQQNQHTIRYLRITVHHQLSHRASTPSGISGLHPTTNCPTEPAHHQVSQDYCPPPIVPQNQHTTRYLWITPHLPSSNRASTPSGISGLLSTTNCPTEPAHHQVSLDYTPPPIVQQSQHTIRYLRITVHHQLSNRASTPSDISGLHPTTNCPTEPAHHQVSLDYTQPPIVQQSKHTIRYLRITVHHQLSHRTSTQPGISGLHPTSHRPTEPEYHQVSSAVTAQWTFLDDVINNNNNNQLCNCWMM